jgi:hypothetical protein
MPIHGVWHSTDGTQRKSPPLHVTRGEAPASFSLFVSAGAVEITGHAAGRLWPGQERLMPLRLSETEPAKPVISYA